MTPQQVRIVRRSFERVARDPRPAGDLFFFHLFEIAPGLRRLFRGDLGRHGVRLVHALGLIVGDLHRLHIFVPALEALAGRCSAHGLEPADYAAFGEALVRSARDLLGADFTVEVEAALEKAFAEVSGVMLEAAFRDVRLAA